jgi:hypothetical protein
LQKLLVQIQANVFALDYFLRPFDLDGVFLPDIFSDATLGDGDEEECWCDEELDADDDEELGALVVTEDGVLAALFVKTSLASS